MISFNNTNSRHHWNLFVILLLTSWSKWQNRWTLLPFYHLWVSFLVINHPPCSVRSCVGRLLYYPAYDQS